MSKFDMKGLLKKDGARTVLASLMSIFIGMLAFTDPNLLGAAKLGVLAGSVIAAVLGLMTGFVLLRRRARATAV